MTAGTEDKLAEAIALLDAGVRNHGWYLRESEHRLVRDVVAELVARAERLEVGLREIAKGELWPDDAAAVAQSALDAAGVRS